MSRAVLSNQKTDRRVKITNKSPIKKTKAQLPLKHDVNTVNQNTNDQEVNIGVDLKTKYSRNPVIDKKQNSIIDSINFNGIMKDEMPITSTELLRKQECVKGSTNIENINGIIDNIDVCA